MADSKITALTALTAADPANDMLPVVDVSDTSMAASGTTKRISINNILACSPSATLASATITGDLTVDTSTLKVDSTNNRVIIGHTSGASAFQVSNAGAAGFEVQPTGVNSAPAILSYNRSGAAWIQMTYGASSHLFQLSGTDGMTLNSTGLGVGGSVLAKISAYLTSTATYNSAAAGDDTDFQISRVNNSTVSGQSSTIALNSSSDNGANIARVYLACVQESNASYASSFTVKTRNSAGTSAERFRIDSSGNVGIGVTPSAWNATYNVLDIGQNGSISGRTSTNNTVDIVSNGFRNSGGTWVYKLAASSAASRYQIDGGSGSHLWYNAVAGTAGNTIAGFSTPIMTLDANGNLILLSSNTPSTLTTNGQLTVNATSNTNLRFSYRGSDGTTRVANITLA